MKKAHPSIVSLLFIVILCLQVEILLSDPRTQEVEFNCGKVHVDNTSVFTPNFIRVMEGLNEKMRTGGFGTIQSGTGPNTNYGLGQCYGDLNLIDCELCYGAARGRLPSCFTYNSGHVYLDGCYIRFANYSFYDEISGPGDETVCGNETRKSTMFQVSARRALLDAVRDAPFNGGFARPRVQLPRSVNDSAYVLANCWRTLNATSCKACLDNASASIMKCLPWSEGRVLNTGCFLRYSDRDFLNAVPSSGGSKVRKGVIIAIVLSSVGLAVVGAFVGLNIYKKRIIRNKRRGPKDVRLGKLAKILEDSRLTFKYSTLQKATGHFDDANKLGQGGFGAVYKGVLADGREIAVKRLFVNNRCRAVDFFNEVNLISSVKHKNLVQLLGCCLFGPESILVYEFIPNMSLDGFLFNPEMGKSLNWQKRSDIVVGIAEGLAYLHENKKFRIIHRDIKSSNILLDQNLRPKIADFGLARTFDDDKSHISTVIAGTLGYMAPEYFAYGKLTEKADVYSFGVLLLEIVTGRRNNEIINDDFSDSLVTSVWKHFEEGITERMFDPNLQLQNYSDSCHIKNEILRVLHVGLLCTQALPHLRPFMSTIVQMLLGKDEELPTPTNPPFLDEETMELNDVSSVGTMSDSSNVIYT